MTFKEIANKITGISIPIFGISWTPAKLEIDVAKKVIVYLEDKRVLYVIYELESPRHCLNSVIQIREFLTTQLFDVDGNSELSTILREMRGTCRNFLNNVQEKYSFNKISGTIDRELGTENIHFYNAMGEFRIRMGILIAKVLIMYGINCESDLLNIIPFTLPDE